MMEVRDVTYFICDYFFTFRFTGDSLLLTNPCLLDRERGDVVVTDVRELQPFGINALEERFKVIMLTDDRLVLRSDSITVNLRKY